jgi:hypothetical protein
MNEAVYVCLECGWHSWVGIDTDPELQEEADEHRDDCAMSKQPRIHLFGDGVEYRLDEQTVEGWPVGMTVVKDKYDPDSTTGVIKEFRALGIQGVVAVFEDGTSAYLDYIIDPKEA